MGMRLPELLGMVRGVDLSDANMLANYLQSFSKSLLSGFDQLVTVSEATACTSWRARLTGAIC